MNERRMRWQQEARRRAKAGEPELVDGEEPDEIIDFDAYPKSRRWHCMYLYVDRPIEAMKLEQPKVEDISVILKEDDDAAK